AIDLSINVRLISMQQVSELTFLSPHSTSVRLSFEAEDGLFEIPIPFQGRIGVFGFNFLVQVGKIALGAGGDANYVFHARFRTRRKIPLPAECFLFSRPRGPGGCL